MARRWEGVLIHYSALGSTQTACGMPCRAPTEEEHQTARFALVEGRPTIMDDRIAASLDPRHVDCPECIAQMPDVPCCGCGAPALYGAHRSDPAEFCAEHAPDDCRCVECGKPLLDASEAFCAGCLDRGDPAGVGCVGGVW